MKRIFELFRDALCAHAPFSGMSRTAKNVYGLISFILALPAIVFSVIAGICVWLRHAHLMNKFLKINF